MAHHYYLYGPQWLVEGAAQFLEAYTRDLVGAESIEKRIEYLDTSGGCDRNNIQEHIDDYGGRYCNYALGERFILAMYETIGREAVSEALRTLHEQTGYLNEHIIYYAFCRAFLPGWTTPSGPPTAAITAAPSWTQS